MPSSSANTWTRPTSAESTSALSAGPHLACRTHAAVSSSRTARATNEAATTLCASRASVPASPSGRSAGPATHTTSASAARVADAAASHGEDAILSVGKMEKDDAEDARNHAAIVAASIASVATSRCTPRAVIARGDIAAPREVSARPGVGARERRGNPGRLTDSALCRSEKHPLDPPHVRVYRVGRPPDQETNHRRRVPEASALEKKTDARLALSRSPRLDPSSILPLAIRVHKRHRLPPGSTPTPRDLRLAKAFGGARAVARDLAMDHGPISPTGPGESKLRDVGRTVTAEAASHLDRLKKSERTRAVVDNTVNWTTEALEDPEATAARLRERAAKLWQEDEKVLAVRERTRTMVENALDDEGKMQKVRRRVAIAIALDGILTRTWCTCRSWRAGRRARPRSQPRRAQPTAGARAGNRA